MTGLDDVQHLKSADPSGMLGMVAGLPDQLARAERACQALQQSAGAPRRAGPRSVVVCGMGGGKRVKKLLNGNGLRGLRHGRLDRDRRRNTIVGGGRHHQRRRLHRYDGLRHGRAHGRLRHVQRTGLAATEQDGTDSEREK